MKAMKNILSIAVAAAVIAPTAHAWEPSIYGSLRIGLEAVDLDNDGAANSANEDDYFDFRDAYSRLGTTLSHSFDNGTDFLFKYEVPFDSANVEFARPDVQSEDTRVFKLQVSGDYGTFWVGQDWTPFYNNIHYPVVYLSSYYSGFTNPSATRHPDSIAYISPRFSGFQVSLHHSEDLGPQDGNQFVVSYAGGKWAAAVGYQEGSGFEGGADIDGIYGASISYTTGPWYFAAKTEIFDSDRTRGFGEDGHNSTAVIGQYTQGKNIYRALLAHADGLGDKVVHLGYDYQYSSSTKFFVEYYYEEETGAIAARPGESTFNSGGVGVPSQFVDTSGGQVLTAGVRYDFKLL